MNRVHQHSCIILKSQAYKETSVIHQVFSRDYGVLSIISKGSRSNNSKHGALLQPFRPLLLSWSGKSDLKTLTGVDESYRVAPLFGLALYCGFYVNELLLNLLHKHDSHPTLFNELEKVMVTLSRSECIEPALRQFEKVLLEEIGYGLALEYDAVSGSAIQPSCQYIYRPELGAVLVETNTDAESILGSTLLNLQNNQLSDKNELKQAKRLMRRLIDIQLDGKMLKSRELFK